LSRLILPDPNGFNEDVVALGHKKLGVNLGEFSERFF